MSRDIIGPKGSSASVSAADGNSLGGGGKGAPFHHDNIPSNVTRHNGDGDVQAVTALVRLIADVLRRGEARS